MRSKERGANAAGAIPCYAKSSRTHCDKDKHTAIYARLGYILLLVLTVTALPSRETVFVSVRKAAPGMIELPAGVLKVRSGIVVPHGTCQTPGLFSWLPSMPAKYAVTTPWSKVVDGAPVSSSRIGQCENPSIEDRLPYQIEPPLCEMQSPL